LSSKIIYPVVEVFPVFILKLENPLEALFSIIFVFILKLENPPDGLFSFVVF
jgi:hypothetical protein